MKWDRDNVVQAIDVFVKKYNRWPTPNDYRNINDMPSYVYTRENIGMKLQEYYKLTYPELEKPIVRNKAEPSSTEIVKSQIDAYVQKYHRIPMIIEFKNENGLPSKNTAEKHLGMKVNEYLQMAYPMHIRQNMSGFWTEEKIIKSLLAFVEQNGRLPKTHDYNFKNGFPSVCCMHHRGIDIKKLIRQTFPQYSDKDMTYLPAWTRAEVETAIDEYIKTNGSFPRIPDFKSVNSLPSYASARKLLGMKLSDYYNQHYPPICKMLHNDTRWTRDTIKKAIDDFVKENNRLPGIKDFNGKTLPKYEIARKCINSPIIEYCQQKYPHMIQSPERRNRFRWSVEGVKNAIDDYVKRTGRLPTAYDFVQANNLPSTSVINSYLGVSGVKYCKNAYPELYDNKPAKSARTNSKCGRKSKWTEELAKEKIDNFIAKYSRFPVYDEFKPKYDLPSGTNLKRYLGMNLSEYKERYYPEHCNEKCSKWDRTEIISAIKEFIKANGRLPNVREYSREKGLPSLHMLKKLMGNVEEFYKKEFPQYEKVKKLKTCKWTKDDIFKAIDKFVQNTGTFPKWSDFTGKDGMPYKSSLSRHNIILSKIQQDKYPQHAAKRKLMQSKWSREKIISDIEAFYKRNSRLPTTREFVKENKLPDFSIVNVYIGSIKTLYKERYPELIHLKDMTEITSFIKQQINDFVNANDRLPETEDYGNGQGLPDYRLVEEYLGDAEDYYIVNFPQYYEFGEPSEDMNEINTGMVFGI